MTLKNLHEIDEIQQLRFHVIDHVDCGCEDRSKALGIQKMPKGYALMLNPDRTHYYWLHSTGMESAISWNKWQVYNWAKYLAKKNESKALEVE